MTNLFHTKVSTQNAKEEEGGAFFAGSGALLNQRERER
jgi:hypothetical protein